MLCDVMLSVVKLSVVAPKLEMISNDSNPKPQGLILQRLLGV